MEIRDRFEWVREKARMLPKTLWMSRGTRGAITRRIGAALTSAAEVAGLAMEAPRSLRLLLASQVYEREVQSYNELTHAELWALDQWALWGQMDLEAVDWLKANFETLLLEVAHVRRLRGC